MANIEQLTDEKYLEALKGFKLTFGGKGMDLIAKGMSQLKQAEQKHLVANSDVRREKARQEATSIKNTLIYLIEEFKQSLCQEQKPEPKKNPPKKKPYPQPTIPKAKKKKS